MEGKQRREESMCAFGLTPMNAISIKNLSKVYKLYHHHADRLKEVLHPARKKYHQDFFALNDVSFDIKQGETVGIIGGNGSGKSTLLKVISGILTPTSGQVTVNGRVSAILELGAGFNLELTGIENIYFSGTIMGFTRKEIDNRLELIVSFADIGDFIDLPVKTYSSGMFIRLAFAMAINVDPDVLLIDEAFAVGDISFQSKCFRKLNDFRKQGKTVIIVTHTMDSVIRYCHKAIVLDGGKKVIEATPKQAVDVYKKLMVKCYSQGPGKATEEKNVTGLTSAFKDQFIVDPNAMSYGSKTAEIIDFGMFDEDNHPAQLLQHGQFFSVRMKVAFHSDIDHPIFAYTLKDLKGLEVTGTNTFFKDIKSGSFRKGDCVLVEFNQILNCQSGQYSLSLGCTGFDNEELVVYHRLYDVLLFEAVSLMPMVGFYDLDSRIKIERVNHG